MTDDFSTELEEIAKLVSAYPRGLAELRELIASLPAPSPLALPGTSETKLPTTDEQTNELSSGPVSAAGVAGSTNSAPASISGGSIIPGTLQAAAFASSIRPIQMIDGPDLPTLPDANFPDGAVIFNLDDGRNYRNDADVWRTLSPERGLGNLLTDPTFLTIDYNGAYAETYDVQIGDWYVRAQYDVGGPSTKPYLYDIYDRWSVWSPFSSDLVSLTSGSSMAAYDAFVWLGQATVARGDIIDLPYVVASIQMVDWGYWGGVSESDFTEAEFGVELWRTGSPATKVAETIVDLKTVPPDFPVQVWISYLRPDPTNDAEDYYLKFLLHVNKVATATYGNWEVALGEPMLHFASTPDPAEFTPAIAKWVPEKVEGRFGNGDVPMSKLDYSGLYFAAEDAGLTYDVHVTRPGVNDLELYGNGNADTRLKIRSKSGYHAQLRMHRGIDTNGVIFLETGTATPALPVVQLGPGNAAQDLRLQRSAAKTLTIDDTAGGAATLNVVGTLLVNGSPVGGGDEALAYIYF